MSKTCANCGAEVPEGSRFCDNCGMPLSEASSSLEAPWQEESTQQAPSASPTPPASQSPPLPPPFQPESPPLPPPPPVEPPPISVPPPPRQDGRSRKSLLILGGGFVAALLVIGGAIWGLVSYSQDEPNVGAKTAAPPETVGAVAATVDEGSPAEEDLGPPPGYQLVENDAGNLSVEAPSGWQDLYTGYDGTLEGEDVDAGVGPAITATPDMSAWSTGGPVPGVYVVASRELAWEYDEDRLAVSGFNDRSPCEAGERQDFDRPPYSGRIQSWDCVEDGSTLFTLGAAPENHECVVMLQVKTYNEADLDAARHILDTFEADCEGIT